MSETPSPLDAEVLLAHMDWVRALARTLLRDHALADDVVQEAFLRALRVSPVGVARLKAWLGRVVENLVRSEQRARVRRSQREEIAACVEALPSAHDVVAHEAARRRVVDAVLALDEPYRSTVVMRFWRELEPIDIARRLGIPAATVRTRLKRALAQLAVTLEREHGGDGRAYALTLASAAGGEWTATSVATAGAGAIAIKLALSAALVAAGVLAIWLPRGDRRIDQRPEARALPAMESAADPASSTLAGAVADDTTLKRDPVASTPPAAAASKVDAGGDLATLRGRCVAAEDGAPLPGCVVTLRGRGRRPPDHVDDPAPVASAKDGRFEVRFALGHDFEELKIVRGDRAPRTARWRTSDLETIEELGDVALTRGFPVRGRVVDESGEPLARVRLQLSELPLGIEEGGRAGSLGTTSDANGAFAFADPIPRGLWPLEVTLHGRAAVSPQRIAVNDPEGCPDLRITMKALRSLSGVVIDEQGLPMSGVSLATRGERPIPMERGSTQADGRFEIFAPDDAPETVQLESRWPGAFEPLRDERSFAWGTRDIRLVMKRALTLALTVVEAGSEKPVEDFAIRWRPADRSEGAVQPRLEGHHPGGTLEVDGILRGRGYLRVIPSDATLAISDEVEIEATDSGVAPLTVALSQLVPLEVRVVAQGTPIAGTMVELLQPRSDPVTLGSDALDLRARYNHARKRPQPLRISEAITDAEGSATLHGPAQVTNLALRALGPGHVPIVHAGIALPLADPPLTIEVVRGCTLRGQLTGDGWRACHARQIDLWCEGPTPCSARVLIAADGSFETTGLQPGDYRVTLEVEIPMPARTGWSSIGRPLGTASVAADRDANVRFDTSAHTPGTLDVRLALERDLLERASVVLRSAACPNDWGIGYYLPGPAGEVHAEGLPPGPCLLTVVLDGKSALDGAPFLECPRVLTIRPGEATTGVIELPHRRLRVHVLSPDGTPLPATRCEVVGQAEFFARMVTRTNAHGWLTIDPASLAPVIVRVPGLGTSEPLVVPEGESEAGVEVRLRAGN